MRNTAQQIRSYYHRFPLMLGLILIILLTASACTFEVQPIEEYTTEDGYLSLTFPVDWAVLDDDSSDGTTTALLGTHEDLVNMDTIPPGEAGVGIMVMPNFIPIPGEEQQTVTAVDLADLMHESAAQQQPGVGEIEQITLANGTDAYTFIAPSPESDLRAYIFSPADEIMAVVIFISAAADENAARLVEAEGILNSLQFNGDVKEFSARAYEIIGPNP